jgi:glycosyltransferase involved in cell wall biosynthesis
MSLTPQTIVVVSTERGWGGGEEQARLLACGLRQRGHACVVFARDGGLFAERMIELGFEVVRFQGKGRRPDSLWSVRQNLRRIRPDVLHFNDSHALTAAGIASLGQRIPARVASRRVIFPIRSSLPYRGLADRVFCVSQAVAEVCVAGGVPRGHIRVVYDGVDPSRVAAGDRARGRRSLGLDDQDFLLLTVAKLTDCKGHAYLLDALPAVVQRFPRVRAVLAGDGELADALAAHVRRLGLESQVRFVGYRQDVPDLLQAADLFVLPSHTEGLCSTLIDAMLAAKPIVTTTAGGIPEVVGDSGCREECAAWSAPPRDPAALAAAMVQALEAPDERRRRGEAGRARAERCFTADHMIDATLAAYAEILNRNASPRDGRGTL